MNLAIFRCTVRQLVSQPVRLGALAGTTILPLLQLLVDPDPRFGTTTWSIFAAAIASAGLVGVEVSTGSVALFFTRPITRAAYIVSRWTAALALACSATIVTVAGECAILLLRDAELTSLTHSLAARLFTVIGVVTMMTFFSCLVSSLGDLVIWLSINIVAMSLTTAADAVSLEWLARVATVLRRIAIPELDPARLPWSAITGYASTLLFALALAVYAMNRKELSYASE